MHEMFVEILISIKLFKCFFKALLTSDLCKFFLLDIFISEVLN